MQRRSAVVFVILNVLVSVGVALALIQLVNSRDSGASNLTQIVTLEVIITATPGPTQTPFVITATPPEGVVLLPTGLFGTLTPNAPNAASTAENSAATLDPTLLAGDAALQARATSNALPSGCILHTIEEGDTPFAIAEEYGADGFQLLAVNGLTEETSVFLQIGQVLIVPLEGCTLTANVLEGEDPTELTEEPTVTDTPDATVVSATTTSAAPTNTPAPTLTATLPPTAENAQMEVVEVRSPGVVTAESVTIRNNGPTVNISGWSLRDADGNTYTFRDQLLFERGSITLNTRVGTDTPTNKFWGQQSAVWQSGDSVTLLDNQNRVQSTYVIP
jgi:LysM repeat protein